ncbi:MAG: carboxypeptidase-like regulatory domain-containing protein, partial [Bacteroidales bacterium]|nr:carboxypeptidase-like regulatory domain-containing protein [Bacteroidales bacterium]
MNRYLKQFLSLLALLFMFASAIGQTGTIRGTVTDKSTGETLPGANILVKGTLIGTSTDFDGTYVLEKVPAGEHT